jgi:hypothetical protein
MDPSEPIQSPRMFAAHLDFLLSEEAHDWVLIDDMECTAVLSLLQYLVEDWRQLPEELIPPINHLNNRIGQRSMEAHPENRKYLEPERQQ